MNYGGYVSGVARISPMMGSFGELWTHYGIDNLNNRLLAITRLIKAQAANT
jgi:hypothetical protein